MALTSTLGQVRKEVVKPVIRLLRLFSINFHKHVQISIFYCRHPHVKLRQYQHTTHYSFATPLLQVGLVFLFQLKSIFNRIITQFYLRPFHNEIKKTIINIRFKVSYVH